MAGRTVTAPSALAAIRNARSHPMSAWNIGDITRIGQDDEDGVRLGGLRIVEKVPEFGDQNHVEKANAHFIFLCLGW